MIARANPFAVSKILTIRYEPQSTTWDALLARLQLLGHRAAIVGPEGSGKTTLLEDLASHLSQKFSIRWFALTEDSPIPAVSDIDPDHLVMVDGADRFGWLTWQKLLRKKTRGLIVTTHTPVRLNTLIQCSTTPELLSWINYKLIGEHANEIEALSDRLFRKHRGNLRDVLRDLYDVWAAIG